MNIHIVKVFSLSVVGRSNGASMKYIYIDTHTPIFFFNIPSFSTNTNMKAFHLSISSFGSFNLHLRNMKAISFIFSWGWGSHLELDALLKSCIKIEVD